MDQWSKTTSHQRRIRIPCNTENFVSIVVPGLSASSSSGSDQSASRTLSIQESHYSTFSSSSSSSPTSRDDETREREDRIESDTSLVPVSINVDDRSGQPVVDQANENPKPNKMEPKIERDDPLCSEISEWLQEFRENVVDDKFLNTETLTPVLLMKYL